MSPSSVRILPLLALLLSPSDAAACPFCDGGPAGVNEVRREVFGPGFWLYALAAAAPFAALLVIAAVVHGGGPDKSGGDS
jgi:hypothetical protein